MPVSSPVVAALSRSEMEGQQEIRTSEAGMEMFCQSSAVGPEKDLWARMSFQSCRKAGSLVDFWGSVTVIYQSLVMGEEVMVGCM